MDEMYIDPYTLALNVKLLSALKRQTQKDFGNCRKPHDLVAQREQNYMAKNQRHTESLPHLIEKLAKEHFPNSPANQSQIDSIVSRVDRPIPPALLEVWKRMNGVCLFDPVDSPYRIVSVDEFLSVNDVFRDGDESTSNWFIFCDILDGNYIAVDLETINGNNVECRDVFHEMFPDTAYCKVIAKSVEEFLVNALKSAGRHYWLHSKDA